MPRHYHTNVIPAVDWVLLAIEFPTHKEHIYRVRYQPEKLARLSQRLIACRLQKLRSLRDGKLKITAPVSTSRVTLRLVLRRLDLVKKDNLFPSR